MEEEFEALKKIRNMKYAQRLEEALNDDKLKKQMDEQRVRDFINKINPSGTLQAKNWWELSKTKKSVGFPTLFFNDDIQRIFYATI